MATSSPSESSIEASCCAHAKKRGVRPVKLAFGEVGMPDRGFLMSAGRIWLVEFKSQTGRLSPRQKIVHAELRAIGHEVSVIYSVAMFKKLLQVLVP